MRAQLHSQTFDNPVSNITMIYVLTMTRRSQYYELSDDIKQIKMYLEFTEVMIRKTEN